MKAVVGQEVILGTPWVRTQYPDDIVSGDTGVVVKIAIGVVYVKLSRDGRVRDFYPQELFPRGEPDC